VADSAESQFRVTVFSAFPAIDKAARSAFRRAPVMGCFDPLFAKCRELLLEIPFGRFRSIKLAKTTSEFFKNFVT
jgi:hypothetical protein